MPDVEPVLLALDIPSIDLTSMDRPFDDRSG